MFAPYYNRSNSRHKEKSNIVREKEFRGVDGHLNKPAQRRPVPPNYLNQQEALYATPPGQAVQNVARRKKHATGCAIAKVMNYLQRLLVILEMLFLLRFILMLVGIDPTNPFDVFLYTLTGFFLFPFEGPKPLVANLEFGVNGTRSLEWATLIAMVLYALFFYLVKRLLLKVIFSPEKPLQNVQKREIHSVEELEQKSDLSRRESAQVVHLQSKGDMFHAGRLYLANEPEQMGRRETPIDGITSSITATRARQPSLVNHHFGDYTLIRQLGQGGYASVYLGMHDYLKTRVALKLLNLMLTSDEEVRHFLFEARILAHLRHRYIVRALDFGWVEDIPFMVMEYAPGGTLHDYFPPHSPLPVRVILPFVLQMASALQYVHDHGLIHCDVKPKNMLLGPNKEVWLSDFGTAQSITVTSSKQYHANELVGTPMYVSPERINGYPVPASDQYALALMVYQWLCGRGPFQGTTLQICHQHLDSPPPRLRDLVPSISRTVELVVLKALAKDPRERFAHVREFAYALKQASLAERNSTVLRSMP
jgi:tRNA A-37 threonylcarbamoyl transferase component Bud32